MPPKYEFQPAPSAYDANPPNAWDQPECIALELRRQDRDREKNLACSLPARSSVPAPELCITPTHDEVVSPTTSSICRPTGGEHDCVLAIAQEYAGATTTIVGKAKTTQGADLYRFAGRCPFCQEEHHNPWVAINQDRFPDTTLLQCLRSNKRRVVAHWPF